MSTIRAIAFYLPQFHPILENDRWWGKGFTEWTNVVKAKPFFKGHYQPHLPADLGFYDLRVPEVREAQAKMAADYGISGFCYYHYWFGGGKRLLNRPFDEVLESGTPDFPFCLCWANETWTGIWHGLPNKTLIEQTYPGVEDYERHFNLLVKAFKDPRYIKVDGKPLFMVYQPTYIPDLEVFVATFRKLAERNGLPGLYLVATNVWYPNWAAGDHGFDAITLSNHEKLTYAPSPSRLVNFYRKQKNRIRPARCYKRIFKRPTHVYRYEEAMKYFVNDDVTNSLYYPMVIPNWDNTARSGLNAFVLYGSTPDLFRKVLAIATQRISSYPQENKIIFIKSWNEWAEGNHLEPDREFGLGYLEAVREVLHA